MRSLHLIAKSNVGAEKIWAGTVNIELVETGAHHHGELESVIYVLSGKAKMRWGEKLEYEQNANPGDFLYLCLQLFRIKKSMLLIVKYLNVYYLGVDKTQ